MTWGWQADALKTLQKLSLERHFISSDDLHDVVGDPPHHNAMGAVFNSAKKIGLIVPTGRFVQSTRGPAKGRNIQVWASAYHEAELQDPDPIGSYRQERGETLQEPML